MTESNHIPPPLPPRAPNFQPPGAIQPTPPGRNVLWFFIGLIAGTVLSAIVWIFGFRSLDSTFASGAIFVMPALKLATGITCLCLRGWRSLGAGILVSLALGFLIFFGVCASHLGEMR